MQDSKDTISGDKYWRVVHGTALVVAINVSISILVFTGPFPKPLWIIGVIFIAVLSNMFGFLWMFYVAARHEERPILFCFLALIPFAFVGYYLKRFSRDAISSHTPTNAGKPKFSFALFILVVAAYDLGAIAQVFWIAPELRFDPAVALVFGVFFTPFVAGAVGDIWMIYTIIRHETNPIEFIFLALIPFVFVWYYFSRFRKGKLQRGVELMAEDKPIC